LIRSENRVSMNAALRALLAAAPLALGACAPPELVKPYRIEIQQGNYVSQEMVAQLRPGMSKEQVRFVLGTPLVTDIFHADRWDYVYYRELPYGKREKRALSVHFENGKLVRVAGDVVPAEFGAAPAGKPPAAPKPAARLPETPPAPAKEPAATAVARPEAPEDKPDANAEKAESSGTTGAPQKPEAAAPAGAEQKPAEQQSERGFFGRLLD
jgi:outer membrane protein assembly factor BamE